MNLAVDRVENNVNMHRKFVIEMEKFVNRAVNGKTRTVTTVYTVP